MLILFPVSFLCVLLLYGFWGRRAAKAVVPSPHEIQSSGPDASSSACLQIIDSTPTNGNYDPMKDILSELDQKGIQVILGTPLHADMAGYTQ